MPKSTTTPAEAPTPRRRRADAERSVAAILDAALEALASDPDSSMSEIARRAGVVRATIYVHFPTRTDLLDAVMEYAVAQVVEAMSGAEPQRGEPVEALERVLRATWRQLAQFHGLLALNTARLSAEELHRRHLPMLDQLEPLIERGQKQGVFRRDLPVAWHLAVFAQSFTPPATKSRAAGSQSPKQRRRMISTAVAAISGHDVAHPNGLAEPPMWSGRGCSRSTTLQQGSRSAAGVRRQLAAPTPSSPPLAYDGPVAGDETFDDVLAANEAYARDFRLEGLEPVAAKGLAVLTCMDSRIEPLAMLGLAPGDAKILRNAGARVTDDVLRTLVLASYLLGVDRAMIVAHTKCRMASGEEDDVHDAVAEAGGPDTRSLAFLVSSDQEETVRDDVQRVRSWPYLTNLRVGGFVYDVDTGLLTRLC